MQWLEHYSHQCDPGSIPRPAVICDGWSLLVLYSAPRVFSLGFSGFSLSWETNIWLVLLRFVPVYLIRTALSELSKWLSITYLFIISRFHRHLVLYYGPKSKKGINFPLKIKNFKIPWVHASVERVWCLISSVKQNFLLAYGYAMKRSDKGRSDKQFAWKMLIFATTIFPNSWFKT